MRKFGVTILQNLRPRWNLAPSQQALIISRNGLQNEAMMAQWGMPPASAKHSFLINARSETVQGETNISRGLSPSQMSGGGVWMV